MDLLPSPKARSWVGSCPTPKALLWKESIPSPKARLVPRTEHAALGGLPLTSTAFHDFRTHEPRIRIDGLSALPGIRRSCFCLCRHYRRLYRPWVDFAAADTVFASVSPYPSRAARALQKPWLQRRPSHSRLIYPGTLQWRRPPPRAVRLCPSPPYVALQPLRCRRCADEQRQQRVMHPRCILWMIRAQWGSSAIFQTRYNSAASPAAAVGSARRRDPCSCRLTGPHGATTVRPRPRRAYTGTPFLRLTPSPGDTPNAHTRSDALGDAAE